MNGALGILGILGFFGMAWYAFYIVQIFLSYGTAYRLTKRGGDNGVALFGWLIVFILASTIPGLGLYFWFKYRNINQNQNYTNQNYTNQNYTNQNFHNHQ